MSRANVEIADTPILEPAVPNAGPQLPPDPTEQSPASAEWGNGNSSLIGLPAIGLRMFRYTC